MIDNKASITAKSMAVIRAVESIKPSYDRICYDPYAKELLCADSIAMRRIWRKMSVKLYLRFYKQVLNSTLCPHFMRIANQYGVSRTRYIDDYLQACINSEFEQLVILGAGYDSRAYRFDGLNPRMKIFEVDHPDTQRIKVNKIKTIFKKIPSYINYVSVDFNEESLEKRLPADGYDKSLKTLFIWEGVTYYITDEAVDATLKFVVKNSCEGSSIIFDYTFPSVIDGTNPMYEAQYWRVQVKSIGGTPGATPK